MTAEAALGDDALRDCVGRRGGHGLVVGFEGESKRDRSGGGLGLAICRMIISEHEGKIWAENTSAGPMISFVIPLRTEASRAPQKSLAGSLTLAEAG